MTHDQVIDRLSEYLDDQEAFGAENNNDAFGAENNNDAFDAENNSDEFGDERLLAEERAAIEIHLANCAECRTTLAELRAVARLARNVPDAPPAVNLWPGIAARLDPPASVVPFRRTLTKRFSFTVPQLAAAALALMVLSGGMVWVARSGDPRASIPPVVATVEAPSEAPATLSLEAVSFADAQYDQAVADLQKALDAGRSRLDPETVRIIEDNLASIDLAIDQARKALRNDPANVDLNTYFASSRNRKLALLRRASALVMTQETSGS
jgi:tetratricopeptide (TPR) repeat protein